MASISSVGSKTTSAEKKSEATTRAARTILESEVAQREAKTARLRQARIEREAAEATEEKKVKRPRKSPRK